jgi:hypothetical protein
MSLSRLLLIKVMFWVSTHAMAFDRQSLTYLAICETAVKTNDKITANLMAEKLLDIWENTEVLSDKSRLMNCLEFSEIDYETQSMSYLVLQEDIRKLEQELAEKCEMLLDVKPRAALDIHICRSIWP